MTQEIITITVEAGQMTARRKPRKIAQRRPVPVWVIVKYAALTIAGIINSASSSAQRKRASPQTVKRRSSTVCVFIKTCGHTLKQSVTKSKSEQRSRLPPSTLSGNASKSTHTWREIWNRTAGSTAAAIRSTGGNLQYSQINNERRVKKWKIKRMEPL